MPPASHGPILLWAALMHATQLQRYLGTLRYNRTPVAQRDMDAAVRRLCTHQAISGTVWGLSPWLFFPSGNMPLTALMMLLLLALSSIGVVALSAYRRAMVSFTVPIFAGLASDGTEICWGTPALN